MKTIRKDFYKDGGSCLLETNKGTFYQDNSIGSKHHGAWYKVPRNNEAPWKRATEENKVIDTELIKQLEDLKK